MKRSPIITTVHPISGAQTPETLSDSEYARVRLLLSLLSLVLTTTLVVVLQISA